MLPDVGTPERDQLEAEAISFGLSMLHAENGDIPNALYRVYMHFREKFIEERGLMDVTPGTTIEWLEMRQDAMKLRDHVAQCWGTAIVREYGRRASQY